MHLDPDGGVIEDRLVELWARELGDDKDALMPLFPLDPQTRCLLFVGVNPSFDPKAIQRLMPSLSGDPFEYFAWSNRSRFDTRVAKELEVAARNDYAFFRMLSRFAGCMDLGWENIDLFFWRETSQAQLRQRVLVGGSPRSLTPFGLDQLRLSFELIEAAQPVAIVIANALASDIYLHQRGLEFSRELGCYVDGFGGRRVPVFPSSMLSGQRALDRYSRERLAWQVASMLERDLDLRILDGMQP